MEERIEEPREQLDVEREFREQQRSGLGATDTPKILGLSRYGTPLSVYLKKVAEPSEDAPASSLPAWMGLRLQSTVAELYTAATGYRVRAARGHYRHKTLDYIVCHLDYRVWGTPNIVVECKTRARSAGWGPDGSDRVPPDVWAQAQHEMLVVEATECHVAVLFGHHSFAVYRVLRDDTFLERLTGILTEFWEQHVLLRVPPPPTGHPVDTAILDEAHPSSDPFYRSATPAQMEVVERLRQAVLAKTQADAAFEESKNLVKDIIGGALGLTGPFGRITWKKNRDWIKTDWKLLAGSYRAMLDEMLASADEGAYPTVRAALTDDAIVTLYQTPQEGTRPFTMEWQEA